jgi:transposase
VTARLAAEIAGVNWNTAILFYHKLREVIFESLDAETPELMAREIKVDESYFDGHRKARERRC